MYKISTLTFARLLNAEHVSLFSNIHLAIQKAGATEVGLTAEQLTEFKAAVDAEQDIVNRSMGSIYTPEMQALDEERDRLFRLIRLKLQSVLLASKTSPVAQYATTVDKYLLTKYGTDVATAAYQVESALVNGFILDVNTLLDTDAITAIGIATELNDLKVVNDNFADQYNERVTERSQTEGELSRRLRLATEGVFELLALSLEYRANTDTTDVGHSAVTAIGVINEIVKDARQRLNQRLGHSSDTPSVTLPEFPNE